MELFRLSGVQVHQYECRGFQLIAPLQEIIFSIFFEATEAPAIQLSWSQLRGCYQFLMEPASNRRERVKIFYRF